MLRELGSDRRETGWSPIYCRRRFLRGVIFSKVLLLHRVICDDNAANNGEILIVFGLLITPALNGSKAVVQYTWGPEVIKTIPWEVDLKQILLISPVFSMEMGAWCSKSKEGKTARKNGDLCVLSVFIKTVDTRNLYVGLKIFLVLVIYPKEMMEWPS